MPGAQRRTQRDFAGPRHAARQQQARDVHTRERSRSVVAPSTMSSVGSEIPDRRRERTDDVLAADVARHSFAQDR